MNSYVETHKTLNFRVSTFSVPSGSKADLHARPEGPSLMGWMDGWMDGMGRSIKWVLQFSSYFVGIQIMYIYTFIRNKNCHQYSYGFQNSMSSWGVGVRFSKLPYSHDFFKIMLKVGCFKNTLLRWTFFQFDVKLGSRFLFVFN